MYAGRRLRLNRILRPSTGRGVVVAFDHGLSLGPTPGIEDIRTAVAQVAAGEPDAVQVAPGVVAAVEDVVAGRTAPALILRVDASSAWRTVAATAAPYRVRIATVEDAVRLGADAVVAYLLTGYPDELQEGQNLADIGALASDCRRWGVPLVVEPLRIGPGRRPADEPDVAALMARMACEAGADVIKADYTGSPDSFARVVRASTAPILIRGGPKMDSPQQVLHTVAEALEAGARGVVFGRNIWQHADPAGMVRALRRIVHEGRSPEQALADVAPAARH